MVLLFGRVLSILLLLFWFLVYIFGCEGDEFNDYSNVEKVIFIGGIAQFMVTYALFTK